MLSGFPTAPAASHYPGHDGEEINKFCTGEGGDMGDVRDSALSTERRKLLLKVHGEQKIVI